MILLKFRKLHAKILSRAFANPTPWKNSENYYNLEFCDAPEYIPYKKSYPVFRILDLDGNIIAKKYPRIEKNILLKGLETMIRAREMDNAFINAQRQNRLALYINSIGEEAVNVASGAALNNKDSLFLQYRELPILLWRGMTPYDIVQNLKGTTKDLTFGKAMPMMFVNPDINLFSISAPVGNRNSHAAGAGYHYRVKKMDKIAFCVFGDGAASEGCFHASMNFSATLGSQTVFLCRNNGFAISTFINEQYAGDSIASRGIGYGMPSVKVDGNDFLAVYYIVKDARRLCLERKGPVLIEAFSYRGGDHSTSDSSDTYKIGEMMKKVNVYKEKLGDPIIRLAKYMEKQQIIQNSEKTIGEIREKEKAYCMDCVKKLDEMMYPPYKTMFEDVYKEMPWNIKEERSDLENIIKKYPEGYPLNKFTKEKENK